MASYVVVEIAIEDPVRYEEYRRLAPDWRPPRLVILEFPDAASARAWWASPEYAAAKAIRQSCARTRMLLIEGIS
jgi:uncharacterized protein (DUF1330 family)